MIISASRRTDIPAFHGMWFMNCIHKGSVMIKNPFNPLQIRQQSLMPADIECIVFWTKNAGPFLEYIPSLLRNYRFYFQYTLNPYGYRFESGVPKISDSIQTFKKLAELCGRKQVWRYDPVFFGPDIDEGWHKEQFSAIAQSLSGYASKCVISFFQSYKKNKKNIEKSGIFIPIPEQCSALVKSFSDICISNSINLETCCVPENMTIPEIGCNGCIDASIIKELSGHMGAYKKDTGQRLGCRCVKSIDIGMYNTCPGGCVYCYANHSQGAVKKNMGRCRADSLLLCGDL